MKQELWSEYVWILNKSMFILFTQNEIEQKRCRFFAAIFFFFLVFSFIGSNKKETIVRERIDNNWDLISSYNIFYIKDCTFCLLLFLLLLFFFVRLVSLNQCLVCSFVHQMIINWNSCVERVCVRAHL